MKIQDIAKIAGVSPATVSRVFSHHTNVSEDIRNKVLEAAKANNYYPSLTSRQRNIVLITPYAEKYPAPSCVQMLILTLTRILPLRNFRLEIVPQDNIERLSIIQFCAAVAIGIDPDEFKDWNKKFNEPLIILDRMGENPSPNVYFVRSDEYQGMALALDKLINANCRKIACIIHGPKDVGNAGIRHKAICSYFEKNNMPELKKWVFCAEDHEYLEIIGKLLREDINALFCPGGGGGILASYALFLFNKNVPNDVSIIASEQTIFSRYGTPPQTTIVPSYDDMAQEVANVIEHHYSCKKTSKDIVLPYCLISRESVK